jgi:tetrahydromethanopterin S-methyltransferase subunit G
MLGVTDMEEYDQEGYDGGELNDKDERLDELEQRIEQLESEEESGAHRGEAGLSLGYAMGMTLAMILSWSRNASILWCILHGLFSWVYVIYVAVTR